MRWLTCAAVPDRLDEQDDQAGDVQQSCQDGPSHRCNLCPVQLVLLTLQRQRAVHLHKQHLAWAAAEVHLENSCTAWASPTLLRELKVASPTTAYPDDTSCTCHSVSSQL